MNNALRLAALAASMAVAATPAFAAPVSASPAATATVTIVRSLTLTANQNLDLGTVVVGNTITGSETVSLDNAGVLTCGLGVNLTCSGVTQVAKYTATGSTGQSVVVTVAASPLLSGANSLTFTPNAHGNVVLVAVSGIGTGKFDLGGAVTVSGATKDGVYSGDMNVTVDYL